MLTDVGPVDIDVPRDRDGQRSTPRPCASGSAGWAVWTPMVISLCATGLTTGEIPARLAELYGAEVSKETVSKITTPSWAR